MDSLLADAARELYAENLFETVMRCFCDANKEYLQKQIRIAAEHLTKDQKEKLRQKGVQI